MRSWLGLLLLFGTAAHAADEDAAIWASLVAQGTVGGALIFFDGHARIGTAPQDFRQFILRPAVGLQLGEVAAHLGYAFVRTGTAADLATEHRPWQQLSGTVLRTSSLHVTGRTRLEQRFLPGPGGVAWRLRQQLRAQAPIGRGIAGVVWTEPFFNLNAPRPNLMRGMDRWRTFAGLSVPVAGPVSVEPGYQTQYVRRRGRDGFEHILAVATAVRW